MLLFMEKKFQKKNMITIEDALLIAVNTHNRQKDLDNLPVILHPIRVGLRGKNEEEIITGILHDVVEDSPYTFDRLIESGVDDKIIEPLKLLTHDKKMEYDEYLNRLINSKNKLALTVKLNDLSDNLSRNDRSTKQKEKIYKKHKNALERIKSALYST